MNQLIIIGSLLPQREHTTFLSKKTRLMMFREPSESCRSTLRAKRGVTWPEILRYTLLLLQVNSSTVPLLSESQTISYGRKADFSRFIAISFTNCGLIPAQVVPIGLVPLPRVPRCVVHMVVKLCCAYRSSSVTSCSFLPCACRGQLKWCL